MIDLDSTRRTCRCSWWWSLVLASSISWNLRCNWGWIFTNGLNYLLQGLFLCWNSASSHDPFSPAASMLPNQYDMGESYTLANLVTRLGCSLSSLWCVTSLCWQWGKNSQISTQRCCLLLITYDFFFQLQLTSIQCTSKAKVLFWHVFNPKYHVNGPNRVFSFFWIVVSQSFVVYIFLNIIFQALIELLIKL